tara:strand:- start:407 stop:607 length:201 start_codon:yes stop_codon:yes gene_type:complete
MFQRILVVGDMRINTILSAFLHFVWLLDSPEIVKLRISILKQPLISVTAIVISISVINLVFLMPLN